MSDILKVHEAIAHLIKSDRFYSVLAHEVRYRFTESVPVAAVQPSYKGFQVLLNPKAIEGVSAEALAGVIKHELQHITHGHILQVVREGRGLTQEDNVAMDLAINQLNPQLLVFEQETGFRGCHVEDFRFPKDRPWVEYKARIQKQQNKQCTCGHGHGGKGQAQSDNHDQHGNQNQQGQGQGEQQGQNSANSDDSRNPNCPVHGDSGVLDDHGRWTTDAETGEQIDQNVLKEQVTRTLRNAVAKSQGNVPQEVQQLLGELLKESKVDWRTILWGWFEDAIDVDLEWNQFRESPFVEDVYPSLDITDSIFEVAIYLDASGSINNRELEQFFAELKAIVDSLPVRAKVFQFDTEVVELGEVDADTIIKPRRLRQGGTSFTAVLDHAVGNGFRGVIVFTDGYAERIKIPFGVNWLWVFTPHSDQNHEGQKIVIEIDD